jgi:hypothetical protein
MKQRLHFSNVVCCWLCPSVFLIPVLFSGCQKKIFGGNYFKACRNFMLTISSFTALFRADKDCCFCYQTINN